MSPSGIKMSPAGIAVIALTFIIIFYQLTSRMSRHEPVSLRALLIGGIDVAERGGDQVRKVRLSSELSERSKGKTKEGANDPLTMGDLLSHQAMSRSFSKGFPNVHLISEEKDTKPYDMDITALRNEDSSVTKQLGDDDEVVQSDDVTVWIDPLDATQEYTENLTEYVTTMVCIAVKGKPVIGIIHKPFTHQTYWAWVNHGTNVVDKKPENGEKVQIIVSRSHSGKVKETAREAFGDNAAVTPAGGAGYKTMELFEGKASVYIHTTLIKKWDICAGNAMLLAKGGKMTTLEGKTIDYSAAGGTKNEGGLVASLHNHETYLKKLGYIK